MKKRALSLLLVFAMILSFVPTTALAAGGEENEITISETPSTDNQEGEPSTSNDSVEPGAGDAVGTANTEDQTDIETGSDAEASSAGTARDGETTQRAVLESGDIDTQEKLQTAVDCNTSGTDQLKLTANIDVTDFVWVDRSFTLDLNGHTITYTEGEYCPFYMGPESAIDVTIKNGSIIVDKDSSGSCGIWVNDYVRTLNLENVKITNNSTYAGATGVTICHSYDATLLATTVNVTNCTITGDGGIFIAGSSGPEPDTTHASSDTPLTTPGIVLNIDAKSTVVSNGANLFAAISGNGNDCTNPSITIAGTIEGGKTDAIYLPQYGTTTINAGAKISGHTGIGMKSGKLIINGGTITGTGDYVAAPDKNGNGINSDGAAIFLESYAPPYAGKMEITIGKDATLTSNESYALRENPNSQQTAIEKITIEDGATLNASASKAITTSIDLLGTATDKIEIKGGTYSRPVKYAYLKQNNLLWQAGNSTGPYTYYATWEAARSNGEAGVTERIETELETDPLITLNYNDGGAGTEDFAVTYRIPSGETFEFPDDPTTTQTTKAFAGWKNDTITSDTDLYKDGDTMTGVTKDITLTATWSDKGPKVILDTSSSITLDKTTNLIDETPENGKPTYTVADKTKDVTFNLTGAPTDEEITVTSQIGTNPAQDLSKDKDGNYVLPKTLFTRGVNTTITVTVSTATKKTVTFDFSKLENGQKAPTVSSTENLTTGSNNSYTVTDKAKSATFKLTEGDVALNYTVKYKVGTGTEVTLEPDGKGVYTLPANLEADVTVTVTATAKKTITFEIDSTAEEYVTGTGFDASSESSNLTPKDSTTTPTKVYVAKDDTKSISFTVTQKANVTFAPDEGIIVKYSLNDKETILSSKDGTYTLAAEDITGDIIVTVLVGATPVYKAPSQVSGSTSTTTITETQVSANIAAAEAQDEPLTIDASATSTTVTKSEVTLGGDVVQAIVGSTTSTNVDLAVKTGAGDVELPNEAVSKIVNDNNLTASDPLTVKVENQDDQIVGAIAETGATNLFDVTLMSGTKEVNAEDLGLTLRITLSFYIEIGLKNPKLYRFEDGKGIELSDVRYDPTTGKISGKTDHLSQFYVVIAPDTTIRSILGNGVVTEGKGGVSAPEAVIVQVPSGEGQPPVISATNILTTDENATVTLYSDSGFRTAVPASGKALVDGPNVVYATVKNGGVDNQSTSYYEITVIKEVAETDCSLESVLGEVVNTVGGSGSQADPYVVTVVSTKTELTASADIKANVASATVKFYNTDETFTDEESAKVELERTNGIAIVYATVANGGKTVYYQIEVTGDAVAELKPVITTDGKVDAGTVTPSSDRKFVAVSVNPESTIASWNTATTETEALDTLKTLTNNQSLQFANSIANLENGSYIVVVDSKSSKIVAAGSVKVQLPVTVTIDDSGLVGSDTLTVTNGSTSVTTGNKVTYGDILKLTLSNANYVVYANDEVVPMNGTDGEGTYKVVGDTTFSVEAAWPVTRTADPKSQLEVKYDNDGNGYKYVADGTNMVPQGARLNITQTGEGKYILIVNGEKEKLTKDKTTYVDVKAATTIEVVPAYEVTINPNGVSNVILTVEVDGTTINNGEWVTKDTELTITFIHGANDTHKVQINKKNVTFDSNNTAVHTVAADTTIEVVSQDASSVVDELNVAVSTSGDVTVMNGSTPVTDAKFILTSDSDLPELTDDLTEDDVFTALGESSYLDRALTASDSGRYLVAVQFSEDGNLIAAGISGKITVSSPTTTTGYTVSGTVSKGETSATVAGILVTLKGADVTKTTTVKADGTYEFVGVDAGTYTVAIALNAASKYDAIDKEVVVDSDETVDITLVVLDPINNWDPLEITSAPIGESERATFTVSNMKAGMYYCITIGTDDTAPSDQFFQADKDFWSFVTDKNSTIYVVEFGSPITFDENGMVDITDNSRYRRADNTDNAE